MSDNKSLFIFGAGGHAVSVANVAIAAGYSIVCFIDGRKSAVELLGIKVVESASEAVALFPNSRCAVAIGDNFVRQRVARELSSEFETLVFPPLIHPSATVSTFSTVGNGTLVMPNAVIGPNSRVGSFCLVNTRASIDHDCLMEDFSSLAPGAVTGGTVSIGLRSAVSIGAVIKHGVSIGQDCVIGANSYLNKNLSSNIVAYGTPAKHIRLRSVGDPYLK
jgi:sugar O-acyltransferase (sialic acid O-acetyltransferase NeuD family)